MHHFMFALCQQVPQDLIVSVTLSEGSARKHLTLNRINSGREEANSPN